jgi:glycosyltransferase involved in cell wall biosynthesis
MTRATQVTAQPAITVIIPCYNKAAVLSETLLALDKQDLECAAFEVVLVDDGSTDGSQAVPDRLALHYECRRVPQEHKGAGAARNLGASLATADLLLFLDSDIVLHPHALRAHLAAHAATERILVLSRILPLHPNPVGLEDLLFQKGFDFGVQTRSLSWTCALTQALSVRKAHFIHIGGFMAEFPRGQDIEFGYRAATQGFEIRSNPAAVGWHNHALDLESRCRTEQRNHQKLVVLLRRHSHFAAQLPYLRYKQPVRWAHDQPRLVAARLLRQGLASGPALVSLRLVWKVLSRCHLPERALEPLYWNIVGSYQLRGLREGIREHGPIEPGA